MKKIITAIIGFGVGKYHALNISKIGNTEIKYICDFNTSKKKEILNLFPKTNYIKKPDRIFKDKDVNLVIISSYDNYHFEHIMNSIKKNKNIFVEKPFCLTEKEFNRILLEVKKTKVKISSNLVLRKNRHFESLKKNIKYFGKTYYIEGDYNYGRFFKLTKGWRGSIPYYSVFLGGGIHLLDLIIWLKNKRVIKVFSAGNNLISKKTKFKYDDFVISTLVFEDGSIAKISANFSSITNHHHLLKVYGEKKSFFYDFDRNYYFKNRSDKILKIKKNNFSNFEKSKVLTSFVKSLYDNKIKADINFIDIKNMMSISFAIIKSLKTKKIIKVNYK